MDIDKIFTADEMKLYMSNRELINFILKVIYIQLFTGPFPAALCFLLGHRKAGHFASACPLHIFGAFGFQKTRKPLKYPSKRIWPYSELYKQRQQKKKKPSNFKGFYTV